MARVPLLFVFLFLLSTLTAAPEPAEKDASVEKALKFLAARQGRQGEWVVDNTPKYPVAATGLAVLAFLSAGVEPTDKTYGPALKKAVAFLVAAPVKNDLYKEGTYSQGIATWALAEYALASGKEVPPAVTTALERNVAGTVQAQSDRGGWRYSPKAPGDLSVTVWMLLSLRAAERAGVKVPPASLKTGMAFVKTCQTKEGPFFYLPGTDNKPGAAMTAAGTLLLALDGSAPDGKELAALQPVILQELGGRGTDLPVYTLHYQAHALSRFADEKAAAGLDKIRDMLVKTQNNAGFFEPKKGTPEAPFGASYTTALGVLTLTARDRKLGVFKPEMAPEK
jgi:hypothetical protein